MQSTNTPFRVGHGQDGFWRWRVTVKIVTDSTTPEEATSLEERAWIARLGPALGVHGDPGALILALREGED